MQRKSVLYPKQEMSELESKFWEYHNANPHVANMLYDVLVRAFKKGFQKYGIGAATEVVRWERGPEVIKTDRFKINNNHRAFYARLFQINYPEYANRVQVREQISV